MDLTILLLLAGAGALILPLILGDEDEDGDESAENEIRGTPEADTLDGTDGDDIILGFDGNDTINTGAGTNFVNAGLGDDQVFGGPNRDEIELRGGNDFANAGSGNDLVLGGEGNDDIDAGYGSDIVRGGRGDDTIYGGFGARLIDDELVNATNREDVLRGEGGFDTIYMWGGGGLAAGGIDDDQNIFIDEKDVLVLVTGEGELRDDEGTTDFFALAQLANSETTFATITEFDLDEHRMILTIDMDLTGETDVPDIDFQLTQTEIDGENGVLVEAILNNAGDFEDGTYEASSAFFRGLDLGSIDPADLDIEVVVTDATTNDYFDPVSTVNTINGMIPDNPPQT